MKTLRDSLLLLTLGNILILLTILLIGCGGADPTGYSNPMVQNTEVIIQKEVIEVEVEIPGETVYINDSKPVETGNELLDNIFSFLHLQTVAMDTFAAIINDPVGEIIMAEILKTPNDMLGSLQRAAERIMSEIDRRRSAEILAKMAELITDPEIWLIGFDAIDAMEKTEKLSKIATTPKDEQDDAIDEIFEEIIEGTTIKPSGGM